MNIPRSKGRLFIKIVRMYRWKKRKKEKEKEKCLFSCFLCEVEEEGMDE